MSEPENNSSEKDKLPDDKGEKKKSENIVKILDELLAHTNSSRRLFLIFIASALFFGPAALVLGGVLIGHPTYNIRQLETGDQNASNQGGMHLQVVSQNGTVIQEMPFRERSHTAPIIFLEIRVFILISVVFAAILLFIAIKEYRFFSHWNKKFAHYKSLRDKVDKELGED
jgi:hypothetical protein